ncbi:MAG: hypothetical protein P1P87_09255, partial [Trueperaceae bacterium]|nr:hypothetical protein [Trueperaceae bacterium]
RRWGYYVVPVVVGDRFVARFDGRVEDRRLRLDGWWWEVAEGERVAFGEALEAGLARFLAYLGVEGVALPRGLGRTARAVWRGGVARVPEWRPAAPSPAAVPA